MMNEHPAIEVLVAYADGELAGSEFANVSAHLGACADCREIVATNREAAASVRHAVAAPPEVPPDLWPGIASRTVAKGRPRPVARALWVAIAAGIVLVAFLGRERSYVGPQVGQSAVPDAVERATHDLEVALQTRSARIDASIRATMATAMRMFDVSIAETEQALAASPGNPDLVGRLAMLRRKRIDALREFLDIIQARA